MPEVDRGGWTLRYELEGSGPELVVMTHGFGATAETWRHQLPALTPEYRVLTWDLRSHGRSGSPDEAITIALLAEDLAAVVRAVGGPAHALGHSAGGVVTMRFALDHPELVRSLVLVGTASECNAKALAWYESLATTADTEGGEAVLKKLGSRDAADAPPEPRGFARIARAMGGLHTAPITSELERIQCPTLVVVGEKDFLGVGGSVIISRRIAGSRLEIMPARVHALFQQDPPGFNAVLLEFLRSVG
ncbi:MAG: alpha/beta hydrolase [Candidatus Binatia bacterium]